MDYKNHKFFSLFCCMLISLLISRLSLAEGMSSSVTYVDEKDKKAFNSNVSDNDVQKLAQSIELKVYKIDEMSSSESVFESPAGICQGFKVKRGVDDKSEYYGSVTGATIYNQKDPQNLSYVPVYSITDKDLSKRIQLKENKILKEKAANYVSEGRAVLTDVICK